VLLLGDSSHAVRTPIVVRIASFVVIVVSLVAGVIVLGRQAADDSAAMALTTGWFALVAVAGLLLARSRRDLLLPLGAGYAAVGVAVAVLLGLPTLVDNRVNERVAVGTPLSELSARTDARNVEIAAGSFEDVRHDGSGRAAVVRLAGGGRVLTLTDFETSNGPDLFVYLVAGNPQSEDEVDDHVNLGGLKGNIGNQQYEIPDDADLARYSTVVVWCRAFSALFTRAPLRAS
jgi:hypothetical protein